MFDILKKRGNVSSKLKFCSEIGSLPDHSEGLFESNTLYIIMISITKFSYFKIIFIAYIVR